MYKLVKNPYNQQINIVQKQEGNLLLSIPFDPQNSDYQQYLKFLEEGGQPLPADDNGQTS
jgi:hypothetical protein